MQSEASVSKLTVRCLGDIAPVRAALTALEQADDGEVAPQLVNSIPQCDLIVANLEAPIASVDGLRQNKRYTLRTDASALRLFESRSVLTLANNHIMDYGEEGLAGTTAALSARGITYAGAGRCLEEACRPALIEIEGVKIAVLCCADPRFQAATAHSAGTCPASVELVGPALRELQATADVVIVSVHMGIEFLPVPSQRQLEFADVCARAGASVVHFHHAHTVSGIGKIGECMVLFGTGNFIFPYVLPGTLRRMWHRSAAWTVEIVFDQRKPVSTSVVWTPLLLDRAGWPTPAPARIATRIDRHINRWSARIHSRRTLPAWRLLYALRPGYLWVAVVNYGDMIRRQGLVSTAREFARAFVSSFMSRP